MGVKTRAEGREGHLRFDAAFTGASICPFVPREIEPFTGPRAHRRITMQQPQVACLQRGIMKRREQLKMLHGRRRRYRANEVWALLDGKHVILDETVLP
jgi:hypothetical protein